jgi:hypothetical protein
MARPHLSQRLQRMDVADFALPIGLAAITINASKRDRVRDQRMPHTVSLSFAGRMIHPPARRSVLGLRIFRSALSPHIHPWAILQPLCWPHLGVDAPRSRTTKRRPQAVRRVRACIQGRTTLRERGSPLTLATTRC